MVVEDLGFEVEFTTKVVGLAEFIVVIVVENANVIAIVLFFVLPGAVEFGAALVAIEAVIDFVAFALRLWEEGFLRELRR